MILMTGATGALGRLVAARLAGRDDVVIGSRAPEAVATGRDGRITAPLGSGRLAAVAREDLADVAALVATGASAHAGRTYELVGEAAVGGAELAAALTEATGGTVSYEPGTLAGAREAFAALGLAPFQVPMLVSTYSSIANGFMDATGGDLRSLLGRAPRSALETITGKASG